MEKLGNYINGTILAPLKGAYIENRNPATDEVINLVPASTEEDLDLAIEHARVAARHWSQTSPQERAQILRQIAAEIEKRLEAFALAESIDTGKPLWLAKTVDIPRAIWNFRFFASAIEQWSSECYPDQPSQFHYVYRQPVGIVACISPWNLPLYLFSWKIAPALATGNVVIGKPSELTPTTAFLLSQICIEVGLPPGVLSILHGYGNEIGEAIVSHPEIKAISFTGGTKTGTHIYEVAAKHLKKVSLELGGKNPFLIFEDAHYEKALETAIRSAFTNQGEICLCGSRILVEAPIYERFLNDFVRRVRELKVGNPLEEDTRIGAVISHQHAEKILDYIQSAKEEGATILTGGKRPHLPPPNEHGAFIEPTVITDLHPRCKANQEEIFGPVVSIIPFTWEEEAIAIANDVPYGLASIVWTSNLDRAYRVAHQLQSGIVWINTWMLRDLRLPFGGMKASGIGREGGFHIFHFFTETKSISIQIQ